ncbi:MAG: hypothetical protein CM15mV22_1800 [Eurybiavirus sp.]|nr:MAG: hypothetical protein CM15mV22_1800 [Eurybiavirus sp.]
MVEIYYSSYERADGYSIQFVIRGSASVFNSSLNPTGNQSVISTSNYVLASLRNSLMDLLRYLRLIGLEMVLNQLDKTKNLLHKKHMDMSNHIMKNLLLETALLL